MIFVKQNLEYLYVLMQNNLKNYHYQYIAIYQAKQLILFFYNP